MDEYGDAGDSFFPDRLYKKVQNRARMKDAAKEFLASSEYLAAQKVLQPLLRLTDGTDARMDVLFQLAECDVMIAKNIREATNEEMMSLLHDMGTTAQEMREIAEQKESVQTVIAHFYACRLYKNEPDERKAVMGVQYCITNAAHEIDQITEGKSKPQAYKASSLLPPMFEDAKLIHTNDAELRGACIGECAAKIGYTLNRLGKSAGAYKVMMEGRKRMEASLGASVVKYQAYAAMANNISASLIRQSRQREAVSYTKKAIEEMQMVVDMGPEKKAYWLQNFREKLQSQYSNASWQPESESWSTDPDSHQGSIFDDEHMTGIPKMKGEAKDDGIPYNRTHGYKEERGKTEFNIMLDDAAQELLSRGNLSENTGKKILAQIRADNMSWTVLRKMAGNRSGAASVVLNLYTCKMLPFTEAPDKVLKEIGECFRRSRNSIDEMIKGSGPDPAGNLLSLLHEMIAELRGVANGRENLKATVEANCLNKLGSIYTQISKYQLAVDYLTEGRKVMSDHFGESAKQHSVFSSLANNIGYAYSKDKDYVKAADYYKTAYDDMKTAQDLTELARNEKHTAYKKAFESALLSLDGVDSASADKIRKASAFHEIMQGATRTKRTGDREERKASYSSESAAEKQTKAGSMQQSEGSLVNMGRGVYVDHTKPLRSGYQVYRGKYGNEDVAVKKIEFSDEHCREVELIKTLPKHKNLVEFKGWAEWESKETPGVKAIYMAMELCAKETLFELAPKIDVFSPEDRLQALLQFTHGLRHIHSHNIIHGDLKPHNLLRSRDGGVVKVADFGISKRLEWGRTHLTLSALAGTFGWMAPDQKLTKKCDIFSAGLIYCYILSGGVALTKDKDLKKLNCEDAVIARDLISRMTDLHPEKRPTVEECCESPLFWDVSRKISFLCEFSRHLAASSPECEVIKLVEGQASDIFGENWLEKLAPRDTVEMEPNAVEREVTTPAIEQVVYERAKVVEGRSSVSSLLQLIADFRNEINVEQQQKNDVASLNDRDIWNFFNTRFPNLFLSVHKIAYKSGFLLSTEEKLKLISSSASEANLDERMTHIVNDSWFDQLILDEATVERMQENVYRSSHHYKISEYAMYNKAVSKDRADEADYDEKSLTSLLRFISNRRKYFKEDGMFAQWLFGDETEGVWDFFSGIFPNILNELVFSKNVAGKSDISCAVSDAASVRQTTP